MEEAEEAGAVEVNDDDHPLPFWIFLFVLNLYDRVNAKRLSLLTARFSGNGY